MNSELKSAIENAISDVTAQSAEVVSSKTAGGGCINAAEVIELADGRRYFVKSNSNAAGDMFEREAEGLDSIAAAGAIKTPDVVAHGRTTTTGYLILESIEPASRAADFSEQFGRLLAELHSTATNHRFGFSSNNYLGSSVQPNDWETGWVRFWREHRLGFQFKLARKNGYADQSFDRMADNLVNRLDEIVATIESPSLIHGDLWSGNYLVGRAGEPVLIDPAVYYGHREAEFGMTTLFGGFDDRFYASYKEVWPLESGSKNRIEIYRLYHLLNHLNLFGSSYRSGCVEIMKKYSPIH